MIFHYEEGEAFPLLLFQTAISFIRYQCEVQQNNE
jgi:hypothetical protein